MRIAYFDCFAGISGDMTLGALLDAGLPRAALEATLRQLPLPGWELDVQRVVKQGLAATAVQVHVAPDEQPHRHLADIRRILDAGGLPAIVRDRATAVFTRLAEAEAAVHGTSPNEVHFHEVGAVDSIVDIVGAVAGLHALGIETLRASPLPLGHGFVRAAHGQLPVPAPAVMQLLAQRGIPVRDLDAAAELVTPTGAALLAALADDFGRYPDMVVRAVGLGAGQRNMPFPNVLRVVIGDASPTSVPLDNPYAVEHLLVLESNLDDMNPEIIAYASQQLLASGALDVWHTPIMMKKGRPATMLSVLCRPADGPGLTELVLAETTSLGVRQHMVDRVALPRRSDEVTTPWGTVRVKVAQLADGAAKVAPEYEDCQRVARAAGVPLRDVYAAAHAAWRSVT
jgi:hypothetical protein